MKHNELKEQLHNMCTEMINLVDVYMIGEESQDICVRVSINQLENVINGIEPEVQLTQAGRILNSSDSFAICLEVAKEMSINSSDYQVNHEQSLVFPDNSKLRFNFAHHTIVEIVKE